MRQRSRLTGRQSKKFSERRKWKSAFTVSLWVIVAAVAVFALMQLSMLGFMQIRGVKVSGADDDITAAVASAALSPLAGDYFGLFPKSNFLIYPSEQVKAAVMRSSARISSVKVGHSVISGLEVDVKERQPAAIVCSDLPDFSASDGDDQCYFADSSGFLFEQAPTFSGTAYNRYYVPALSDNASSTGPIGLYATSTSVFRQLQDFYLSVMGAGMVPEGILAKDGGQYELYINNPGSSSLKSATSSAESGTAVVYFDSTRPFSEQLANLTAFWKSTLAAARAKSEHPQFDYIDLRYGSNVFYRIIKTDRG